MFSRRPRVWEQHVPSDIRYEERNAGAVIILILAIGFISGFFKYPGHYHSTPIPLFHFSAIEGIPERNCYGEYSFEKDWP